MANNGQTSAKEMLYLVHDALAEKGYNPINQLTGYLVTGDPSYITVHNNAKTLIRTLDRDEYIEELLKTFFGK